MIRSLGMKSDFLREGGTCLERYQEDGIFLVLKFSVSIR